MLGKPVVVPASSNFLDIIDNRSEGITFEEGNAVALEQALVSLCEEPELRRQLGIRAREKVVRRLNWQWNANEVCRHFSA